MADDFETLAELVLLLTGELTFIELLVLEMRVRFLSSFFEF